MANLRVRVTPGAREDAIVGWREDALRVRVRAAPEKGKANEALCRFLASALGVSPSAVSVVRGGSAREKVLAIDGMTDADVMKVIPAAIKTRVK